MKNDEELKEYNRKTIESCKDTEVVLWTVASGRIDPLRRDSRRAVSYIKKRTGFVGIHMPDYWHTLFLFDTEEHAKRAKNDMEVQGIQTGNNVCAVCVEKRYLEGMK